MPSAAVARIRPAWIVTLAAALGLATALMLAAADDRTRTLLQNTLLLAAAVTALSVPLGTLEALLLVRTDLPRRGAGMALLAVMLLVPLYLQAAAWQAGFGLQGWYPLAVGTPAWLQGWTGAIWIHTMAAVPWATLIVGAGLWLAEPELEEQAMLDGSPWQVFLHVTLPGAAPAVGVAALWVLINTAGEMTVTDLFGVRTYAEEIYTRLAIGDEPATAPLAVLPGTLITACLAAAGLVLCAFLMPGQRPPGLGRRRVFRLGRLRWPMALLAALLLLLVVGIPLGNLCYKAGLTVSQVGVERFRSWSAWKFLQMVFSAPVRHRKEFGWSLGIGTLAATAALAAAVPLGCLARQGIVKASAVLAVTALFLAVPGPALGLAIIWLLNRPEHPLLLYLYDRSILAPWLALLVRGLPLATLIVWHAVQTVPREMLESAAVDGAGRVRRLVWIALPTLWPALAAAWLVALAVALGELAASILVVPPGVTTLSIRIFGLLHYGVEDQVAGVCLALMAGFVALAGVVGWLGRRWGKRLSAE